MSNAEVSSFYKDIESLMNNVDVFCPKSLETVLKTFNIHKDSPFVVDLRLKFIWKSKNNSKILNIHLTNVLIFFNMFHSNNLT